MVCKAQAITYHIIYHIIVFTMVFSYLSLYQSSRMFAMSCNGLFHCNDEYYPLFRSYHSKYAIFTVYWYISFRCTQIWFVLFISSSSHDIYHYINWCAYSRILVLVNSINIHLNISFIIYLISNHQFIHYLFSFIDILNIKYILLFINIYYSFQIDMILNISYSTKFYLIIKFQNNILMIKLLNLIIIQFKISYSLINNVHYIHIYY